METEFRAKRAMGRKLLVPYITGGYPGWQDAVRACAAAGADAIEIGIPFSDPVMDGPIIQQASQAALEGGATPVNILHEVRSLDVSIPIAVMLFPGEEQLPSRITDVVEADLQRLVNSSLLRRTTHGRYALHAAVRTFAQEHLAAGKGAAVETVRQGLRV